MARVLDSRSEGLGFDSQCWSCVAVSGKLRSVHPAVKLDRYLQTAVGAHCQGEGKV